jgi:hypothetical protein
MFDNDRRHRTKIGASISRGMDGPAIGCTVVEISDRSARISVPNEELVSNEFTLLFGGTKKVGRQCEVVGRNHGEILVHFSK